MSDARRRVDVVPHTHWDREWYRSFQSFRLRLVELLDGLLPRLAADPSYAHFMLDGQMAVVDDYLAVRPEAAKTLRRLAASGRISLGPWYILMDEFLVSGETMVRNLELGLDRAASFGGGMEVGYLPDMFGHVAQMPQLLAQFGFGHAVVWRGVPAALGREAFRWEAPDGTAVRAEYLATGYANGAVVPDDAKELVARVDEFCAEQGSLVGDPVLWMNGFDHLMPQTQLGRVVAEANAIQDDYRLVVTSLADHLVTAGASRGQDDLPAWRGELRSGARANLLMGVASNRVDVHQAEARTQVALERLAEPLSALFLPAARWPAALLDLAWLEVIRNSAHDSICACSVDAVGAAVLHRFTEVRAIADGLCDRSLKAVAVAAGGDRPVVVNPAARARSGVVELTLPGDAAPEGTQLLAAVPARVERPPTTRAAVTEVVLHELALDPLIHAVDVDDPGNGDSASAVVTLHADRAQLPAMSGAARQRLETLAVAGPADAPVRVVKAQSPTVTVLARVADVAGFGWKRWTPAPVAEPVTATLRSLVNGLVKVVVDLADGTWAVDGLAGFGRLVDDGDAGDTYNWCPPARDTVVDRPDGVAVEVLEDGPVRGRLLVTTTWRWPHRVEGEARVGERVAVVRTTLEVCAGEDLVRVTHEVDNPCRDHRLRAWFPLPEPATTSMAECAFTVVERGLTAEGGPSEAGIPTFPSRRFVVAGGLTVAHEGLLEYELVDVAGVADGADGSGNGGGPAARALALTLLRCTGVISRGPMATRRAPAGPAIAAEAAQMPGLQRLRYAVHTGRRDPFAVADDAFLPLLVARPRGGPATADESVALRVSGAQVSAVTRRDGRLSVRVFNPTAEEATVVVDGRTGWLVDLRGRPVAPFEASFPLRPHGIATVVLD